MGGVGRGCFEAENRAYHCRLPIILSVLIYNALEFDSYCGPWADNSFELASTKEGHFIPRR